MTGKKENAIHRPIHTVDVRDQECSKPVVSVKSKLKLIGSGECIEVLATESAYEDVVRIFGKIQGHRIVEKKEEGFVRVYITKK